MIPVTTRLPDVARMGLAPTLRALLHGGIPAAVLEAPSPDEALAVDVEALRVLRAPLVGAIAPITVPRASVPALTSEDAAHVRAAANAIRATAAAVAPLSVRNVIVVAGAAGFPGEESARAALAAGGPNAVAAVAAFRAATRAAAERRVLALCRALHGIARAIAPQRLLVLPGADPLGILDVESAGWLLDDLRDAEVGLALDTGWTWAAETAGGPRLSAFLEAHAARLGFLLISDHDAAGCGEVLPGAGLGDFSVLRDAIGRRTPRAVRPAPRASLDDVIASVAIVARQLGAVGEVVGW